MFTEIRNKMQKQFNEIVQSGTLYYVEVDKDEIWNAYLNAFDAQYRQENTCNCCKSFIRQYAGVVGIKDNQMITLWDFETDDAEYKESITALRKYIKSLPIKGIFLNTFAKCGTDKNPDIKRNVIWNHFYLELPKAFVKRETGPLEATALDNKNVLQRSLNEITDDAVDTVLELIAQNSLYRGNEFDGMVKEFKKVRTQYKRIKNTQHKDFFCWQESAKISAAVCRIRNSSIGTLLNDLSEGKELDKAVTAFERVVAPSNYKRPTALVTPRMIEDARKRLEELGLTNSLYRRVLSSKDLNVTNTLYVYRPQKVEMDIFEQIKKETPVNPKSFSKIEEISIGDFMEKVLPTSKSVKVLVENKHLGNFVTLVGPKNQDDSAMFKWKNNFSWSYSGNVADSIKERVKSAGGKVDGVLRISLSWDNTDDLDLHLYGPSGSHVSYTNRGHKQSCGATLDIDANGLDGLRTDPVENIYWDSLPREGSYQVIVNNYNKRGAADQGYTIEIEYDGQTYHWSSDTNNAPNKVITGFDFSRKDGIKFTKNPSTESGKYNSKEKWGIKTGQFVNVKAITLSPNYWDSQIGNKHHMFFLENCKSDETPRAFYNEFLKEDLSKDRKVFEVLGNRVTVEPTDDELSGIGFSDTVRNDLIVEIQGAFKRTLKIKF